MKSLFVKKFIKILFLDKITIISVFVLIFWIVLALFPFFSHKYATTNLPMDLSIRLQPPNAKFWFGTDSNGQSLGLLIVNGAMTSLMVSLVTVFFCLCLGIPCGALAGFYGGKIDIFFSRCMDILLSFPPMILPIAIMAFFGGGLVNVVLALSTTGWVSYARLVRGQFLVFKEREFVIASRSLGSSNMRLMLKHIFPNIISPIAVQSTFSLASVVISEAGLSFLGLGVSQEHASWGTLLNAGRDYLMTNPNLAFFPSLALFSLVASLNFLGEALRLTFDPRSLGVNI